MNSDKAEQLGALIDAEARSWLNTPYHHLARVKGHGVDCIQLVIGIAENVFSDHIETPYYPAQWHMNQKGRQLLLDEVVKYCDNVADDIVQKGDVVLFWYGHAYSHSAMVMNWPECIHASLSSGRVELIDAERDEHLARCKRLFFRPKQLKGVSL